jgi:hypothetical protein
MPTIEPPVAEWVARVRADYREMPGMCLTSDQMCRFWHLDPSVGAAVAKTLVDAGFLRRLTNQTYVAVGAGR